MSSSATDSRRVRRNSGFPRAVILDFLGDRFQAFFAQRLADVGALQPAIDERLRSGSQRGVEKFGEISGLRIIRIFHALAAALVRRACQKKLRQAVRLSEGVEFFE